LTASLIRTYHPRRLWNDNRKRRKKFASPVRTSVAISHPSWTGGMFGFKARAFLKRIAKFLAEEWEKTYPIVRGFINARMIIALVRATNRCIRGSRIPTSQHVESLSLGRRCRIWTSEK